MGRSSLARHLRLLPLVALVSWTSAAQAQSTCRSIDIQLQPVNHLQIAVWIEDTAGNYVDTVWITRSTGQLGLGNRPGNPMMKSSFRWPYGARTMVLPVWAHARNKSYPFVTMGGAVGQDTATPDNGQDSCGYHEPYSSTELFYCKPTPAAQATLDATSCASQFNSSKGLFVAGKTSLYPPRADLTTFGSFDSNDAKSYVSYNDLAVISGATPPGGAPLTTPLHWQVPNTLPSGQYVVKVEVSLEADFNDTYTQTLHPPLSDAHPDLVAYGYNPFGQPSVVYATTVQVDGTPQTALNDGWAGYGDWDGATGTLHAPDGTISDSPGTGAGRLAHVTDADGTWRIKAFANGCTGCATPSAVTGIVAKPNDTSIEVDFDAPVSTGPLDQARRYEIRYQAKTALTDANFSNGIAAGDPPAPGSAGAAQSVTLTGLMALTSYNVGVRAINACGTPGPAVFANATTTQQKFVTLHGCFIATAAFGSAMEPDVMLLRQFRDSALLGNPLGKLAVASYYALSPPLAHAIATDDRLRSAARTALEPAVALARAWLSYNHRAR